MLVEIPDHLLSQCAASSPDVANAIESARNGQLRDLVRKQQVPSPKENTSKSIFFK